MSCLFCDIVNGKVNCKKLYEDDEVLAFEDVAPQAPVHFLVIPKKHIESLNFLDETNAKIISKIFIIIKELAEKSGLEKGFRVVNNCNKEGGQTVMHLHFHVLGKREMLWPPG